MVMAQLVRLGTLDAAVVVGFIACILALGFSARLRENSVLQYLAAGRSLTLPMFVATLVSTWYGGILGVSESVAYFGVGAWLLIGAPYYMFGLLYARFLAGRVREAGQISLPERLHARFGRAPALMGGVLLLLLAVPAAHALMLGVLVRSFTGWDLAPSVLAATAVGSLFLYRGGLLADVRVSMLAFAGMYVGFAAMLVWCLSHYPFPDTWIRNLEPSKLQWTGGQNAIQIVSFFVLGAWTLVDPGFHQRTASAASPAVATRGIGWCVAFWFLFDALSISCALFALSVAHASGVSLNGLEAFPAFAQMVLPPGLKALFVCGMLGTILSALVGYALVSGATVGREIAARVAGAQNDAQVNLWTKYGIGLSCLLAAVIGLTVESVVSLWYGLGGAVVGALLLPVCGAYGLFPRWRMSGSTVGAAIALSGVAGIGLFLHGIRTGDLTIPVHIGSAEGGWDLSIGTLMPGLAVSAIVLGFGAIPAIIRGRDHGRE